MADDAAAPDGELSETTAAEPESTAIEETGDATDKVADESEKTPETSETDAAEDEDDDAPGKPRMSHVRLATIAGLVLVLALGGLTGWLGFRAYESHQADEQRKLFLQVGRQGALNLTSIDFQQADADVQRILDSATGTFYDDFQERAQPFVDSRQAGAVEVRRNRRRGRAGVRIRERGRGVGGGDGQDLECRCARTGATRVAHADHGGEGR